VDGGIARLLAQSQQTLKELGCELVEVNIDEQDLSAANAAATLVLAVESATLHAAWLREQGARYTPQVRARLERGFAISGPQYLDALRYRALTLDKFLATVFARVDVLHTPVTPILTPDLVATDMPAGPELDRLHGLLTRCLRPMNYLGLPALSLPIGFLPDGMPSAMQLIGRPFDEPLLLNLGHAYQQATDWHRQRPPLPDAESAASPAL
jgi:aspartyl-tRNA(Asn)/glutamyl-tRNA(Gln) amidotransferase subunit A